MAFCKNQMNYLKRCHLRLKLVWKAKWTRCVEFEVITLFRHMQLGPSLCLRLVAGSYINPRISELLVVKLHCGWCRHQVETKTKNAWNKKDASDGLNLLFCPFSMSTKCVSCISFPINHLQCLFLGIITCSVLTYLFASIHSPTTLSS